MKLRRGVALEREPGGRTRLFDPRTGGVYALNRAGDAVVALVERGATRAEMCAALVERFDVTPLVASTDLDLFLATLERHGLVER